MRHIATHVSRFVVCVSVRDRGVGSSLKLEEQKGGLLWRTREREPIKRGSGAQPPAGVQAAEPPVRVRGKAPEAGDILVPEHTFLRCPDLLVVADLTEATRQRRTFDTAAVLSAND